MSRLDMATSVIYRCPHIYADAVEDEWMCDIIKDVCPSEKKECEYLDKYQREHPHFCWKCQHYNKYSVCVIRKCFVDPEEGWDCSTFAE